MEYKITLKAARVNAGLTAKGAASELGVSEKTVNFWENGRTSPTADNLIAICELYKVPMDCLILQRG